MDSLDAKLCKQLADNIEELTTNRPETKLNTLKNVKSICRKSDEYVKHTYHLLMHQLEQDHAEIRLYALNVVDELFRRSHAFRELLLADFQLFMEFTVETDPDYPLPPPKTAAKNLKAKACQLIQQWNDLFSSGYKQLQLGYRFLKDCKKIDFTDIQARSVAERRRQQQEQQQRDNLSRENARKALKLMSEKQAEIQHSLTEFDNAFRLLMSLADDVFTEDDFQNPRASCSNLCKEKQSPQQLEKEPSNVDDVNLKANSDVQSNSSVSDEDSLANDDLLNERSDDLVRIHGLGTHTYSLPLEISIGGNKGIVVTKDNTPVIATLKELIRCILSNYLPAVTKWVQILTKSNEHADQLKKTIDMKRALQQAVDKYKELKIPGDISTSCAGDDSDDEFEEVPEKEGYEAEVKRLSVFPLKSKAVPEEKVLEKKCSDLEELDPTTPSSNMKALIAKISQNQQEQLEDVVASCSRLPMPVAPIDSQKQELLSKAPKLRFDVDLLRWNEKLDCPAVVRFDSLHRFWQPIENETTEIEKSETEAKLRTRRIEFSGDFKPVKWQCRAPLPSGKLCPRFDRQKCPFHGPVIPRDTNGNPTNPEDMERIKKELEDAEKTKPPDWQDPELLREIEAATGVDLTVGKKSRKGRKKKRQYPELTDLKEETNTSRRRLERKVLNKSAVKRISSALDAADYSKHRDKFGEQFNYSLLT